MNELLLADGFTLPLQAVTETFAILAKRGSGKTSTAVVLAEEMVGAGQQVLVVDPTGVWWGLRAGRDGGQTGGLPVVIIGGDHADLPLPETDGAALAKLLIAERVSAVLDLSQLSKSATRRVMADFLETLYRLNRDPLHLIVDEADLLAPQRLPKDMLRLLGAMEDVVRRGRAHGLGVTLITQRPAVLNKDVLGQAEVLIALRMTSPRDVAAIDEWIRLHADTDQATELRRSLPSLPVGAAWVWSPGWLERLERVAIRPRSTFDSSATPKPGTIARRPRLAPIDVDRLRQQLQPPPVTTGRAGRAGRAITQVSADELAAANRRIVELEQTVHQLQDRPAVVEIRAVPVIDDPTRAQLLTQLAAMTDLMQQVHHQLADISPTGQASDANTHPGGAPVSGTSPRRSTRPATVMRQSTPEQPTTLATTEAVPLRAGARRMLAALASRHPAHLTRAQLATLAKMRPTSGTYSTYLSDLRRHGYLEETDGRLHVTAAGRSALGAGLPTAALTAADVREQWRSALRAGARRMLDTLVHAYPRPVTRTELGEAAELSPSSGTFGTYLSDLRRNGLAVEASDGITATKILFIDPTEQVEERATRSRGRRS